MKGLMIDKERICWTVVSWVKKSVMPERMNVVADVGRGEDSGLCSGGEMIRALGRLGVAVISIGIGTGTDTASTWRCARSKEWSSAVVKDGS